MVKSIYKITQLSKFTILKQFITLQRHIGIAISNEDNRYN